MRLEAYIKLVNKDMGRLDTPTCITPKVDGDTRTFPTILLLVLVKAYVLGTLGGSFS